MALDAVSDGGLARYPVIETSSSFSLECNIRKQCSYCDRVSSQVIAGSLVTWYGDLPHGCTTGESAIKGW